MVSFGTLIASAALAGLCVSWVHQAFEAWLGASDWAHLTIEASLNLLWLAISVSVLGRTFRRSKRAYRPIPAFINVIFALALLFPVISANDDFAQCELINDAMTAKSFAASFKTDKQVHVPVVVTVCSQPLRLTVRFPVAEVASPLLSKFRVAAPGETTGNHSPPLS